MSPRLARARCGRRWPKHSASPRQRGGNYLLENGTDAREYGGLDGIPEARRLGAEWLGVGQDEVMAGGLAAVIDPLVAEHQADLLASIENQ